MFCQNCGADIGTGAFCSACGAKGGKIAISKFDWRWLPTSIGILVLLTAGLRFINDHTGRKSVEPVSPVTGADVLNAIRPQPVYVPRAQSLIAAQIAVPRGALQSVPFTIDADRMQGARVVGRFEAAGGRGNDVEVFITDADGLVNLQNGHPADVLYQSGKVTTGEIAVSVPKAGSYFLVFNNRFSVFSDKFISGPIELRYMEKQ